MMFVCFFFWNLQVKLFISILLLQALLMLWVFSIFLFMCCFLMLIFIFLLICCCEILFFRLWKVFIWDLVLVFWVLGIWCIQFSFCLSSFLFFFRVVDFILWWVVFFFKNLLQLLVQWQSLFRFSFIMMLQICFRKQWLWVIMNKVIWGCCKYFFSYLIMLRLRWLVGLLRMRNFGFLMMSLVRARCFFCFLERFLINLFRLLIFSLVSIF